jgi:hypothetical protein
LGKAFDTDFLPKYFYGVFELPLPRNAQKRTKKTPKHLGFRVYMPFRVRRDTPLGLKMPASWRNGISDYRTFWPRISGQRIFFFGGHIFLQFKSKLLLRELPGSVAGVYKCLFTPGRRPFHGAFVGVFCG